MKKFLYTLAFASFFAPLVKAQDPAPANTNFDRKFRFGLRVTPQPTWVSSSDKNNTPNGAGFGFGFGLNMEFRFSDIAALQTGIGGDFENIKYKLRHDPLNGYDVTYWQDESGEFIEPSGSKRKESTIYHLKERKIRSTFVTIPLILKLSTKEYNGLKYFGMFGGELAVRLKGQAEDTYYNYGKYQGDTLYVPISNVESTESSLNVTKELFPVRLAFNAGAGAEYRLGGSTSLFISINYFRSLTTYMNKESNYLYYRSVNDASGFRFVKQALTLNAIKINIGIMF